MRDLKSKLAIVRRYTGDKFSAARGYDLRKPLSKARMRTIERYFSMIEELTSRPHKIIRPPKGAKREMFQFTGQITHPRFSVALVPIPDPSATYRWELDKTQPKGSRFILINRRTRERMWHIPASVFEDAYLEGSDGGDMWDNEDISPEFFADVLEEYAVRGDVYMIEAGEYHMWGAAGHIERVSEKLAELVKQYGADRFDRYDANSNWIGNWFRGVQVFGINDAQAYLSERTRHEVERLTSRYGPNGMQFFQRKHRILKSGDIAEFYQGRMIPGTARPISSLPGYLAKKPPKKRPRRRRR